MLSDTVSTTGSEMKKSSKPVMEKRRRARINASLSELKSLLLEVIKKEGTRHSKMEKADILELTVRHLRQLSKDQATGVPSMDGFGFDRYRLGFNDCVTEMSRYLSAEKDINVELRLRVLDHLSNYLCDRAHMQPSHCTSGSAGAVQTHLQNHVVREGASTQPKSTSSIHVGNLVQPGLTSSDSDVKPTFVHMVNSTSGPTILSQLTTPQSTNHNRSTIHMTSVIPQTGCQQNPTPLANCVSELKLNNGVSLPESTTGAGSITGQKVFNNFQLVQTKLPTGGMAYVLPANVPVLSSGSIPSYVIPVFTSPELVPGSTVSAQQPVSLATVATPSILSKLTPENNPSSSVGVSSCVPTYSSALNSLSPTSRYLSVSTGKLTNNQTVSPSAAENYQEHKHTPPLLSSVIPPLGDIQVSVSSPVTRAAPEVPPDQINMADMWRPW